MEIELDELMECKQCGVVFNLFKCSKEYSTYYKDREGKCPVCKCEFYWNDNTF